MNRMTDKLTTFKIECLLAIHIIFITIDFLIVNGFSTRLHKMGLFIKTTRILNSYFGGNRLTVLT